VTVVAVVDHASAGSVAVSWKNTNGEPIWRQYRAEAGVGAVILAGLVTAVIVVGTTTRDRARSLGLPACANTTVIAAPPSIRCTATSTPSHRSPRR